MNEVYRLNAMEEISNSFDTPIPPRKEKDPNQENKVKRVNNHTCPMLWKKH